MTKFKQRNLKAEASLFRYLRGGGVGGRLHLAECGGELWWSNAYMMAPVTEDLRHLLGDFNLKAEPMVCMVERTIIRTDMKPAAFDKLVPPSVKKWKTCSPLTVGSEQVYTIDRYGDRMELWSTDGKAVTHRFASKHLAVVLAAGGDRMLVDPIDRNKACVRVADEKPVGLVMPYRTDAVMVPWTDEAEAA